MNTVFQDDFRKFAIGPFPYDPKHSALGEYHYIPPEGHYGQWYDPIVYYGFRGPSWIVTEDNGRKFMEQTRVEAQLNHIWPLLVAGDTRWKDYTFEASVRFLSTRGQTGIVFRYTHGRRYYFFGYGSGKLQLLKRNQEQIEQLAAVDFICNCDDIYRFTVVVRGSKIVCYVDDNRVLEAEDSAYESGKIGLTARMPAQFTDIVVTMDDSALNEYTRIVSREIAQLGELRAQYPQPKLWKAIDLKNFGAARQIRFGRLTGTDDMHIVFAQHQKRGHKDAYAHISCLTAINLDGEILWQIGEPSTEFNHAIISADLPFQVCDVDGDGADEVIVARNFQLMILDGRTGAVKKSVPTPLSEAPDETLFSVPFKQYAFDRVNVDSIRIADLSGKGRPTDILIKDRYSRVWAYDNELNLLWHFHEGITGHFPYTADIDGDGKDEMFVGYHLVDHDGKLLWTLPVKTDHTDEILIGKWNPNRPDPLIALASGDEGFIIADLEGNIIDQKLIGHAQRISVGNYRPDLPGLELCVTTYWGNQGIIYIFDGEGRLLHQFEPECNGNLITPVNWTGDGSDLILLNGSVRHGGLIDGHGRRVVQFPDDGHPELCAEVIDLTGDARDEIVLWDQHRMYIYTQDRPALGEVSAPEKYPLYNASNYRGEYHYRD